MAATAVASRTETRAAAAAPLTLERIRILHEEDLTNLPVTIRCPRRYCNGSIYLEGSDGPGEPAQYVCTACGRRWRVDQVKKFLEVPDKTNWEHIPWAALQLEE